MATEGGILGRLLLSFQPNEHVLESPDLPQQTRSAAPDLQAIITVSKVTSGAALTGVADLKAAP